MKALICGIRGQDGAYLAKFLLEKGYEVIGTSRDSTLGSFDNLIDMGIYKHVKTVSMAVNDFRNVLYTLKHYSPDEVYNLSGQTSVALSFEQPLETMESISGATLNLLESIRLIDNSVKFYNAGSSECFGDTGNIAANEMTPFKPRSPYGIAKASAHWLVNNYRESYGLFACSGILFNHESIFRPDRFVTQKIVKTAARISKGSKEVLRLGNISIERDWGWAPDYVDAMWRMLNNNIPQDYVIATGRTVSLKYFVDRVFSYFGMDWTSYVSVDNTLIRPADILVGRADPSKARDLLRWSHTVDVDGVISHMCEAAINKINLNNV